MRIEIQETISTTQLARHLSAAIDRVRVQHSALAITKGKRTVAQLGPPPQDGYPVTGLAAMLARLPRLQEDADDMADDVAEIRRSAALPSSSWES